MHPPDRDPERPERPPRRPLTDQERRQLESEVSRLRELLRLTASGGPYEEAVESVLAGATCGSR